MRDKLRFLRNYFANKPIFWYGLFAFALIFPIISYLSWYRFNMHAIHPYDCLWMGFYSIFALLFFKRSWGKFLKIIQVILIAANSVTLLFWCLTMLIGGIFGPLGGLLMAAFPFILWF